MATLTDTEWDENYTEVASPQGESTWSAHQISALTTSDPLAENRLWTLVEGDGGLYIVPGWHYVNRIGYLITEEPVRPADFQNEYVWALNSDEDEEGDDQ